MNVLTEIPLENDWSYYYAANDASDYSLPETDEQGWIPLPLIGDWAVSSSLNSGADWFRRVVTIEPTAMCVRYKLHVENVPEHVTAFVNGVQIGTVSHHNTMVADVTNQVSLGTNVLALKLVCTMQKSGGSFHRVYLEQVACD